MTYVVQFLFSTWRNSDFLFARRICSGQSSPQSRQLAARFCFQNPISRVREGNMGHYFQEGAVGGSSETQDDNDVYESQPPSRLPLRPRGGENFWNWCKKKKPCPENAKRSMNVVQFLPRHVRKETHNLC